MKLSVEFDGSVARYSCDTCYNCTSKIGESYCKYTNRGCCFYYPKFNLLDLQKMIKNADGREVILKILNNTETEIFNYFIEPKGYFDKEGYNDYMAKRDENSFLEEENDPSIPNDKTVHFKACPFVVDGVGCSIPPKYRTPVCNFFICEEIKREILPKDLLEEYENEAREFYKYYEWENQNLIEVLEEKHLNLKDNFKEVLMVLEELEYFPYDFPKLKEFNSEDFKIITKK